MSALKLESSWKIFAPIIITLLVVQALVMYSIRPYGFNITSMIRISEDEKEGVAPQYFQEGMVIFERGGYDGQFYYYVAMDPFLEKGHFKNAYRHQRILYPLLSSAVSFGNDRLIPYAMYAVNLAALAFGMYFLILILKEYSLSPMWSILYGLSPPSIMTIQYDLPSPLSIALIIAATYFYIKDRVCLTAIFFALAFLTREDSIVVFLPLLLWDYQQKRSFMRIAVFLASLVPFFLFQYWLTLKLNEVATETSSTVVSLIPFSGIMGYFGSVGYENAVQFLKVMSSALVLLFFISVFVIMALRLLKKRHVFYYVVTAYCALSFFTVPSQWDNYNGLLRMFYGIFPFLVLSYGIEKDRSVKYAVYFTCFLIFFTFARILFVSPVYPFKIW